MFTKMAGNIRPLLTAAAQRQSSLDVVKQTDWLLWFIILFMIIGMQLNQLGGYHVGFTGINTIASYLPDVIWSVLNRLADQPVLLALALLAARSRPEIFWSLVIAAITGFLYVYGLKDIIEAGRPSQVLDPTALNLIGPAYDTHSFPSGHSVGIFLMLGVLGSYSDDNRIRILLVVIASLIAFSRVAVGVHWPQDIIAGAIGGLGAAWIGVTLSRVWHLGYKPLPHLLFVLVCVGMAISLFVDDGAGYPESVWLVWPIAFSVLATTWNAYWPYWR